MKKLCVEVSNAVIVQVVIFWVMTLCSLVGTYHCLEEHPASVFKVKVYSVRNRFSYMDMLQGRWPLRYTERRQSPNRKTTLFRATVYSSSQQGAGIQLHIPL
jgi:hypothetical protein